MSDVTRALQDLLAAAARLADELDRQTQDLAARLDGLERAPQGTP